MKNDFMKFAGIICFGKPSNYIDPIWNRFIKSSKNILKFFCLSTFSLLWFIFLSQNLICEHNMLMFVYFILIITK